MQQPVRADMECEYESPTPSTSRRTKALVAGVAAVSASALALTPVMVTPTLSDEVRVTSTTAVGLSAFDNPLEVWQGVFTGPAGLAFQLETLADRSSASWTALADALGDPEVQARFTSFLRTNLQNPMTIPTALAAAPAKYGPTLSAASQGSLEAAADAITGLFTERHARNDRGVLLYVGADGEPTTTVTDTPLMAPPLLQETARLLAAGNFTDAFSEVNLWLLMDVLSDQRAGFLDAVRVPGDFLEDIGAETLARILGTSWMDPVNPDGSIRTGWGDFGLLSRARVGNLARAVLAPPVTAMFQTVEILDAAATALQANDFETLASHLINAPARITNAFFNGYASDLEDADAYFPGLFSDRSTFNFVLSEIPRDIANVLKKVKPAPVDPDADDDAALLSQLASDGPGNNPLGRKAVVVEVDTATPVKDAQTPVAEPVTGETPAVEPIVDEDTAGEGTTPSADAKALTAKDRLKQVREQVREQAAEQRKERAEKARETVDRVRSNIRKGLGIDKAKQSAADKDAGGSDAEPKSKDKSKDNGGSDSDD